MKGYLEREPAAGAYDLPDARGHFDRFGGKFVPETVMPALEELEREFRAARRDPEFRATLRSYLTTYSGRPTALTYAERLTRHLGGPKIYLKREDLNHTGAHKINNTLGQGLLTRRMGKKRIIAETGAGQHGVASATAAAMFGLECKVFMGAEDVERQALNVYRMKLLGAEVVPVQSGTRTLKDATNEAIRHWVTHVRDTHYIIGSVVGPAPYPMIVREFQSVIGLETIEQIRAVEGRLPDAVVACVGGGSNAMGMFHPFIDHAEVALVCVEAAGHGLETNQHGASLAKGEPGVLHGSLSMVVQTETGQIQPAHSISAGLDYPGVGPELAYLGRAGRVRLGSATDTEALEGFRLLARTEGIIPALESAHAIAHLARIAPEFARDAVVVLCLSGRGDKDVVQVSKVLTL